MPKFPTYCGTLPKCLSPFRPRHYLLLAYWIYFRPTALKCYFHQAIPELFDPPGRVGFLRRWRNPAYQNLYLMAPMLSLFLSLLLSLPVTFISAWVLDVPVNWGEWRDGVIFGVALGVPLGIAVGMVGSVLAGQAVGSVVGVMFGVTIGLVGGMTLGTALGVAFANTMDRIITAGGIFGIMGGMALTLDVEMGVILSLTFAVMGGISFVAEYWIFRVFGVRFGALIARWVMSGAFIAGAFRLILYPFQFVLAFLSAFKKTSHPIEWDELTVLSLPFTRYILREKLRQNESEGLRFLARIGRNQLRRASVRAVLYRYLHTHPRPFVFLYNLLTNPDLEEFVVVPLTEQGWERNANVRRLFLGELALLPVETTHNPRFHRSAWWLNIYKRRLTPLTCFARMLFELLDEQALQKEGFDPAAYREVYTALSDYPDGNEIARSFETIALFLAYHDLASISGAPNVISEMRLNSFFRDAIRPAVLTALNRLGGVGKDIAIYRSATGSQKALAALARATGDLNELSEYVDTHIITPEKFLLQQIIRRWQQLIIETIGNLGKLEIISELQNETESEDTPQVETTRENHNA